MTMCKQVFFLQWHIVLLCAAVLPAVMPAVQAQQFIFETLTTTDGLSDDRVSQVLQDQQGFMWFGTEDGLNRYDGYHFTVYRHAASDPHSLSHNTITALYETADGGLWVGTQDGLNRYDPATESFTRYRQNPNDPTSLQDSFIQSIYEDRQERLWIGTLSGGLHLFDPETEGFVNYHRHPEDPTTLSDNSIKAICEDHAGRLWIGTDGGGLNLFDPEAGTFIRYPHTPGDEGNVGDHIHALLPDENGGLWVGRFQGGLDYFDPQTSSFTHYGHTEQSALSLNNVSIKNFIKEDHRLWISSNRGVHIRNLDTGATSQHQHNPKDPTSLSSDDVMDLYEDASGVVWIATYGGGVNMVAPRLAQITYYTLPDLDTDHATVTITALLESHDGILWIGTDAGVLVRFDRATASFTSYRLVRRDHPFGWIIALHEDAQGRLWASLTSEGLARFDPASENIRYHRPDPNDPGSLSDNTAPVFLSDSKGRLWVGTDSGGLNLYSPQRDAFSHYRRHSDEKPDQKWEMDFVNALAEDPNGTFWIGTWDSGVVHFDPDTEQATYYPHDVQDPHSLPGNAVHALHVDQEGRLWVGLHGHGLARFDPATQTFVSYREKDGLANDFVYAILEDEQGRLWLSTNQGLSRFDPHTERFYNIDLEGQHRISYEVRRAAARSTTGELFFSAGDRLASFFPDQIKDNPYRPPVVITTLERTNADSLSGTPSGDRTVYLKNELAFSYKDRILTFEVAALSYHHREKNRYSYQLAGFSDQWIDLGTQRRFTFTSLDPGAYTLSVRGSNNDGVWGEETRLRFTIAPPWWRTGWAYSAGLLLLGLAAFGLVRNQMNRIHLQNRLVLEQVRAESLHNLDLAKSRFFANVSHEFRTPLLLILGPLEDVQDGFHGEVPPEAREQVNLAAKNGHRLLHLVNQLLDVSRLEAGRLTLQARERDAVTFLTSLAEPFAAMAERKPLDFRLALPNGPLPINVDPDQFEKIISNLLGNAFKFTPAGGTITLSATAATGLLVVTVQDTGPGIAPEHLPHIFERFYQVDASSTRRQPGTGIGLALAKELVALHHGAITAESEEGTGSTFTVRLPLGRAHLSDDELAPAIPDQSSLAQPNPSLPPMLLADDLHSENGVVPLPDDGVDDRTTVLVVDDNADVRTYTRRHLERHYRVVEAVNGQVALETARSILPDLIVSDVMMPEMDGYAFCQAIKSDPELDFIPVILLTAKASAQSKIEGLEEGADDYLTKPFNARELEARIRNLIASRQRLKARFSHNMEPTAALLTTHPPSSSEEAFAHQFREAIAAHLAEEALSVDMLADAVGVSRATLYRRVREVFDQPPMELVWQLRLEQAARWLQEPDVNVSEVAYGVGFRSISHFSNRFRDHFGVNPSTFRTDAFQDT